MDDTIGIHSSTRPCVEYHFRNSKRGYGVVPFGAPQRDKLGRKRGRKSVQLHRWVMSQVIGRELTPDEVVRHTCDNPPCFLFEHLRLGTQADNIADMTAKGRARNNPSRGSAHPMAKLDEADIVLIRSATGPQRAIALRFGVSQALVCMIRRGTIWAHVPHGELIGDDGSVTEQLEHVS